MMTQTCKNKKPAKKCCEGIAGFFEPRFFKALCDRNRIAILSWLAMCAEPQKVTDVTGCCAVDVSVVSRHLATLRDAGVVQAEKRGKEVYYSVKFDALVKNLRRMADAIENCCGGKQKTNKKKETKK